LQEVVEMAKQKSIASKQATTIKETKYWEWRTYKSNYAPQLALNGILPGYSKSFIEVQQPDGTILFQPEYCISLKQYRQRNSCTYCREFIQSFPLVREILLNHGFEFSLKTVTESRTEFFIRFYSL
jgi:hypothetical protein